MAVFAATVTPGPNNLLMLRIGLENGRHAALAPATGVVWGALPCCCACAGSRERRGTSLAARGQRDLWAGGVMWARRAADVPAMAHSRAHGCDSGVVAHVICCGCFSSVRQPQAWILCDDYRGGRRHGGIPGNAHRIVHPRPLRASHCGRRRSLAVAWRDTQRPACASNAPTGARCSRCRGCCAVVTPARGQVVAIAGICGATRSTADC